MCVRACMRACVRASACALALVCARVHAQLYAPVPVLGMNEEGRWVAGRGVVGGAVRGPVAEYCKGGMGGKV